MAGGRTSAAQPERRIVIWPEAFGHGYDVVVDPPSPGEVLDREFPDLKAARGYAGGLRLVRGWPILDQVSEL